jgi:hypothetical protein
MIKVFVLELLMTLDDGGQSVLVASFKNEWMVCKIKWWIRTT